MKKNLQILKGYFEHSKMPKTLSNEFKVGAAYVSRVVKNFKMSLKRSLFPQPQPNRIKISDN